MFSLTLLIVSFIPFLLNNVMIYHRLLDIHYKLKIIKIEGTMEWEWILAETLFLYHISIPRFYINTTELLRCFCDILLCICMIT